LEPLGLLLGSDGVAAVLRPRREAGRGDQGGGRPGPMGSGFRSARRFVTQARLGAARPRGTRGLSVPVRGGSRAGGGRGSRRVGWLLGAPRTDWPGWPGAWCRAAGLGLGGPLLASGLGRPRGTLPRRPGPRRPRNRRRRVTPRGWRAGRTGLGTRPRRLPARGREPGSTVSGGTQVLSPLGKTRALLAFGGLSASRVCMFSVRHMCVRARAPLLAVLRWALGLRDLLRLGLAVAVSADIMAGPPTPTG